MTDPVSAGAMHAARDASFRPPAAATPYQQRREEIQTYFDRTAAQAWARLTSTAPVGRIRATVRAGRDAMRGTLLGWLPDDLRGQRLLDAGCGTGALAVEAARRGAEVVAIDLSPTLVDLARERLPRELAARIDFRAGDMLDPALGHFDHVVAMDSLIHYGHDDALRVLSALALRTRDRLLFTFAPRTPALAAMHAVGRLFPRGDRAPAIEPIVEARLRRSIVGEPTMGHGALGRTQRIASGFYTSQALEWRRDRPAAWDEVHQRDAVAQGRAAGLPARGPIATARTAAGARG